MGAKMKKYFSFIGGTICRSFDVPKELLTEHHHHVQLTNGYINVYDVKDKPNLMYVERSYNHQDEQSIIRYVCLRSSLNARPSEPRYFCREYLVAQL